MWIGCEDCRPPPWGCTCGARSWLEVCHTLGLWMRLWMGRWVPDDLSQVPLLDRECHPSPAHPLSMTPPFLSRGHPIHPLGAGAMAPGQSRTSQPHLSPCDHCPFSLPQFHVRDEPGGRAASQAAREPPRTPPRVLQQGAVSGRMPASPARWDLVHPREGGPSLCLASPGPRTQRPTSAWRVGCSVQHGWVGQAPPSLSHL